MEVRLNRPNEAEHVVLSGQIHLLLAMSLTLNLNIPRYLEINE